MVFVPQIVNSTTLQEVCAYLRIQRVSEILTTPVPFTEFEPGELPLLHQTQIFMILSKLRWIPAHIQDPLAIVHISSGDRLLLRLLLEALVLTHLLCQFPLFQSYPLFSVSLQ